MIKNARIAFRPDVEGLRALAVILVVAAHIKIPFLLGGFVGVDVFFVISGFLMTGLLVGEVEASGKVDLFMFYAKRLLRLMPALMLVFFISVLAGMLLLSPLEQINQVGAAMSVPLWMSNLYFMSEQMDYFGPQADSNLFLHTWSLGVEEQFYLVWPALLLFLMGSWRWQSEKRGLQPLPKYLGVVCVLGLIFCMLISVLQPKSAYYMMPTRIWQFTLGGLVYLIFTNQSGDIPKNPIIGLISKHGRLLAILGVGGVVLSSVLLDGKQVYPGYWALLPTLATCLVIAASSFSPERAPFLLLNPVAQSIGKVSYGFYLWHWPVLLLGAQFIESEYVLGRILLMVFALVAAYAMYYWYEKPIRQSSALLQRPKAVITISIMLMAASFFVVSKWTVLAEEWSQGSEQKAFTAARGDVSEIYRFGCDDWYRGSSVKPCIGGNPSATKTAILFGDSIGAQWYGALSAGLPKGQWRIVVLTKSACPMVDAKIFYDRISREYTECEVWRNDAVEWISAQKPDLVILGSASPYNNLSDQQWFEGSRSLIAKLSRVSRKVIIVSPYPTLTFDGPYCLARRAWKPDWAVLKSECTDEVATDRRNFTIGRLIEKAAKSYPNASVIRTDQIVCPDLKCRAERNQLIVFRDTQHLTDSFVNSVAESFVDLLEIKRIEEDMP